MTRNNSWTYVLPSLCEASAGGRAAQGKCFLCHFREGGNPGLEMPFLTFLMYVKDIEFDESPIIMEKQFYVYILSSKRNGTLYIGVTSDLIQRIWQHKNNEMDGFTSRFNVHHLVYYEECSDAESAILREKQLKKWNRIWKIRLIEKFNPEWNDLYQDIVG